MENQVLFLKELNSYLYCLAGNTGIDVSYYKYVYYNNIILYFDSYFIILISVKYWLRERSSTPYKIYQFPSYFFIRIKKSFIKLSLPEIFFAMINMRIILT